MTNPPLRGHAWTNVDCVPRGRLLSPVAIGLKALGRSSLPIHGPHVPAGCMPPPPLAPLCRLSRPTRGRIRTELARRLAPGRPDQARARVVDDQWSPVKGLGVEATDGFLRVETMLALPRDREAKVP
jgi:hypothetical protein